MYSLGPIEFIVYERETNQYLLIRSCAKCLPSGGFHLEIPFVRIGRTQPLESLKYQDAIKSHRVIENHKTIVKGKRTRTNTIYKY